MRRMLVLSSTLFLFACDSPAGMNGIDGTNGTNGTNGANGRPGPRGLPGIGGGAGSRTELLLPGPAFYPEGIAASKSGALYAGSLPTGEIVRFLPGEVIPTHFAQLEAVAGLLADDTRNLLIACNNNLDFTDPTLTILDLDTAEPRGNHRLPVPFGFCNDLILDDAGNLYATESLNQLIVQVAAAELETTTDATTWASGADFTTPPQQFGLNGILYDGTGSIYAGNYTTGTLHRITIATKTIQQIALPRPLAGLDGFEKIDATTFLAVEQYTGSLTELRLASATATTATLSPIANGLDTPTTFAIAEKSAWIIEGQLDHFLGYDPTAPSLPFRIARIPLDYELPLARSELAGHWTSDTCEPLPAGAGPAAITRDFAINEREWSLLLTFYADAACATPAFTADIIGPYHLGERSRAVAGATQGDFGYRSILFTALNEAMTQTFESAACGTGAWELGAPQEVGETGCLGVAPKIDDCPFDHDIVHIDRDRLYFGQRGADMCLAENRPTTLTTTPVLRR